MNYLNTSQKLNENDWVSMLLWSCTCLFVLNSGINYKMYNYFLQKGSELSSSNALLFIYFLWVCALWCYQNGNYKDTQDQKVFFFFFFASCGTAKKTCLLTVTWQVPRLCQFWWPHDCITDTIKTMILYVFDPLLSYIKLN